MGPVNLEGDLMGRVVSLGVDQSNGTAQLEFLESSQVDTSFSPTHPPIKSRMLPCLLVIEIVEHILFSR